MSTNTRARIFPKYKIGNQSHTLTVVPCKMRPVNIKFHSPALSPPSQALITVNAITIDPGGNNPTLTINRAELAALLVAVQKGVTKIATDSASSLFQI